MLGVTSSLGDDQLGGNPSKLAKWCNLHNFAKWRNLNKFKLCSDTEGQTDGWNYEEALVKKLIACFPPFMLMCILLYDCIYIFVYLYMNILVYLYIYVFIYLPIHIFVYLYICGVNNWCPYYLLLPKLFAAAFSPKWVDKHLKQDDQPRLGGGIFWRIRSKYLQLVCFQILVNV